MRVSSIRRGFTLIELLLYIALASLLTIAMSMVSIGVFRLYEKMDALEEVAYTTSFIVETLRHVQSGAYNLSVASSSVTFSMYDPALDPTVISLQNDVLYIAQGEETLIPLHSTSTVVDTVFSVATTPLDTIALDFTITVSAMTESPLTVFEAEEEVSGTLMIEP